jgi:hypothetical protein
MEHGTGYILEVFPNSAGKALRVEAGMVVEIFIFDGNMGLDDVVGELVEGDELSVLVGVDLIKELAVAVEDISGEGKGLASEFFRRR